MKQIIYPLLIIVLVISYGCKRDDDAPDYGEFSNPAFEIYQEPGNLEHLFARCLTEDIELDTVIVVDPINITYNRYFQGQLYLKNQQIDLGDTFVPSPGKWEFRFRGRKVNSGVRFSTYQEQIF